MNRRQFLGATAATAISAAFLGERPAKAQPTSADPITRWNVHGSEGFDAIAFLGALSGGELYLERYSKEAGEFGARMPASVRKDLANLAKEADTSGFGLLWPNVATSLASPATLPIAGMSRTTVSTSWPLAYMGCFGKIVGRSMAARSKPGSTRPPRKDGSRQPCSTVWRLEYWNGP